MDVCYTRGFNQFQRDGHKVKPVVFNSGMMPFSFCIIMLIACIHDMTCSIILNLFSWLVYEYY